jgi:hypothetical protein
MLRYNNNNNYHVVATIILFVISLTVATISADTDTVAAGHVHDDNWHQQQRHLTETETSIIPQHEVANAFDPKTILYKQQESSSQSEATSTSTPTMMPMIINLGQGSTATRSLFHATCQLNLPSVHWTTYCKQRLPKDEATQISQQRAEDAHGRVIGIYTQQMQWCMEMEREGCSIEKTIDMFDQLKQAMQDLIRSGGAVVLMDTPYTRMLPFLMREIKDITGLAPVLLLSERDPRKWSQRRFDESEHVEVLCRTTFSSSSTHLAAEELAKTMVDPFDLEHCLSQALQQQPPPTKFSDVFTSNIRLKDEGLNTQKLLLQQTSKSLRGGGGADNYSQEVDAAIASFDFDIYWKSQVLAKLAHAMETFQRLYEPQSSYHVDLFALDPPMNEEDLAKEMFSHLTSSSLPETTRQSTALLVEHYGMELGGRGLGYMDIVQQT